MSHRCNAAMKLCIRTVMPNFMRVINGITSKLCEHAFVGNYTKLMI